MDMWQAADIHYKGHKSVLLMHRCHNGTSTVHWLPLIKYLCHGLLRVVITKWLFRLQSFILIAVYETNVSFS